MKLSEFKNALEKVDQITFIQPDGFSVPAHFHVTEIGKIEKHFIDCGGVIRDESVISFQLWVDYDVEHRFSPEKLLKTIAMSEEKLGIIDNEIEVEYQSETIGKYNIDFDGEVFQLQNKHTDCLAKDNCGVPIQKQKVKMSELQNSEPCCDPSSGCC